MAGLDSFTLIILGGGVLMIGIFVAMYVLDHITKKRQQPKA